MVLLNSDNKTNEVKHDNEVKYNDENEMKNAKSLLQKKYAKLVAEIQSYSFVVIEKIHDSNGRIIDINSRDYTYNDHDNTRDIIIKLTIKDKKKMLRGIFHAYNEILATTTDYETNKIEFLKEFYISIAVDDLSKDFIKDEIKNYFKIFNDISLWNKYERIIVDFFNQTFKRICVSYESYRNIRENIIRNHILENVEGFSNYYRIFNIYYGEDYFIYSSSQEENKITTASVDIPQINRSSIADEIVDEDEENEEDEKKEDNEEYMKALLNINYLTGISVADPSGISEIIKSIIRQTIVIRSLQINDFDELFIIIATSMIASDYILYKNTIRNFDTDYEKNYNFILSTVILTLIDKKYRNNEVVNNSTIAEIINIYIENALNL